MHSETQSWQSHFHSPIIRFGKHKGRHFQEARLDPDFLLWIQYIANSPNPKSSDIGKWYLTRLTEDNPNLPEIYVSPKANDLQVLIAAARDQLAELDAAYMEEHQAVQATCSKLFTLLRPFYEMRDDLLIKADYRRRFLDALIRNDQEAAETIAQEGQRATEENHQSYEQTANDASETRVLSNEEQAESRDIYRKLASLYHPDRYVDDANKQAAYAELMKLINQAKDSGAIAVLREISQDPNQYLASHGYELISINYESEVEGLASLLSALQDKILESQKLLDDLRASSDYELWKLGEQDPNFLEVIAKEQQKDLESEIWNLEEKCSSLAKQINELAGPDSPYSV